MQTGATHIRAAQRLIRRQSLRAIQSAPYNIKTTEDGALVGLRYDDVTSDTTIDAVKGCRGLILDRENDWAVVSPGLPKFFNLGESQAATVDWSQATAYEKYDGTCCILYHYGDQWCVHTLGTLYAEGRVQSNAATPERVANQWSSRTFGALFWEGVRRVYGMTPAQFTAGLSPQRAFTFELCTPANRIVTQYESWHVVLTSVRQLGATLDEIPVECVSKSGSGVTHLGWMHTPKSFDLNDPDAAQAYVDQLPDDQEGVVVRDDQFNRVKIKADTYVEAHRQLDGVLSRDHGLFEIVLDETADDFVGKFPGIERDVERTRQRISAVVDKARAVFEAFGGPSVDPDDHTERKEFAIRVNSYAPAPLSGPLFAMLDGNAETAREAVCSMRAEYVAEACRAIEDC